MSPVCVWTRWSSHFMTPLSVHSASLLYSLTSTRNITLGNTARWYKWGKTSATPPSLEPTETADFTETHNWSDNTHTYDLEIPHTLTDRRVHPPTHTHPPPSLGSQHQSAHVQSLWWCYPQWCHHMYRSPLTPSPLADVSTWHQGSWTDSSHHRAAKVPSIVLITMQWLQLRRYYWQEAAVALLSLWGELCKRRDDMLERESHICLAHCMYVWKSTGRLLICSLFIQRTVQTLSNKLRPSVAFERLEHIHQLW